MAENTDQAVLARFDDLRAGTALQFSTCDARIVATHPGRVQQALHAVEQAVAEGSWAFGYVAYEAAPGLDPHARVHDPTPGLPLVWFGISERPDPTPGPLPAGGHRSEPWRIEWSRPEHAAKVVRVHDAIAAGDSYQCNLTTRMRSRIDGDLLGYHGDLVRSQQAAYNAYLDLGRWVVASASPECFLRWNDDVLVSVPMKGTAPRGASPTADQAARRDLLASAKDRAENVMIVDLIRNDLSRVARSGTVTVAELLACEQYPTVWQLTSSVTSRTRPGTTLVDVFAALFPCGSVTGAPKTSTMALIADLESGPRGVYCGAIGYLAPGPLRRASFNVAIRTVLVDRSDGSAVYGVGGGVTWSSRAEAEYREMEAKARVLAF
ncbi:MAG: aminodeoxychorismate synthase component I [Propionibacteriaceae bacterium]|nr:aminodeoxychorismate synthase component I [Propionibacteriaceae bacterium]